MERINHPGKYELSSADFLAVSRGLKEMESYFQKLIKSPVNSPNGVSRRLGFNYLRTTVMNIFQALQGGGEFVFSHETFGRYNVYVPAWLSVGDPRFLILSDQLRENVDRKLGDFDLHRTQGDYDDFISREEGEIRMRYDNNLHNYSKLYGGDKVIALNDFRPVQEMREVELFVLRGNFPAFARGVHSAHQMYTNLIDT